ncbi:MAG: LicD family protein [Eubacteriales bacterium]|nr:LicD family protein [Eubacteriales bacterium]
MTEISTEEYKRVLKNMLFDLDRICTENDISYFVSFGSLLGTVRHNGFIPWDDDVDISLYYTELPKLKKALEKNEKYYILDSSCPTPYYNNFPRFCSREYALKLKGVIDIEDLGAFIDIFVLYDVPSEKEEREKLYRSLKRDRENVINSLPLRCFSTLKTKQKIKKLLSLPGLLKNRGKYSENVKKRDETLHTFDGIDSTFVASLFDHPHDRDLMKKEDIFDIVSHSFEDIEVKIPRNYDLMLTTRYGDYMKLPPEKQRRSTHHFKVYKKEC